MPKTTKGTVIITFKITPAKSQNSLADVCLNLFLNTLLPHFEQNLCSGEIILDPHLAQTLYSSIDFSFIGQIFDSLMCICPHTLQDDEFKVFCTRLGTQFAFGVFPQYDTEVNPLPQIGQTL